MLGVLTPDHFKVSLGPHLDHTANQTIRNLAVPGVPFVYVG